MSRRSRDVPRKFILNICTKHIYVVKCLILAHQICVLDTKKLFLKTPQSDTRSVMSLGRPQDVNLIIIHKIGF